jgi:hypothetical protein
MTEEHATFLITQPYDPLNPSRLIPVKNQTLEPPEQPDWEAEATPPTPVEKPHRPKRQRPRYSVIDPASIVAPATITEAEPV